MPEWVRQILEAVVMGGIVAGITRYFVQDFLDRRTGHLKRTEEYQENIEAFQQTMVNIEARQLSRQEAIQELLEEVAHNTKKG